MIDPDLQYIELQWQQVASTQAITGVQRATAYKREPHDFHGLVYGLAAYLLKDQGGKPVTDQQVVARRTRPRWLPRFLWRRMPMETSTITLTAHPEWTYPQATIEIPALNPAVRFVRTELDRSEWVMA